MEWQLTPDDLLPMLGRSDTLRPILEIEQPQFNHNGGGLYFGLDNMLYISLGDDGGADDEDGQEFFSVPMVVPGSGNGQDKSNPLGSILRIDTEGSNSAKGKYGIPEDNPFIDDIAAINEIFAYGFRNPFRFSFDNKGGNLYVADVGQNKIEEVK